MRPPDPSPPFAADDAYARLLAYASGLDRLRAIRPPSPAPGLGAAPPAPAPPQPFDPLQAARLALCAGELAARRSGGRRPGRRLRPCRQVTPPPCVAAACSRAAALLCWLEWSRR